MLEESWSSTPSSPKALFKFTFLESRGTTLFDWLQQCHCTRRLSWRFPPWAIFTILSLSMSAQNTQSVSLSKSIAITLWMPISGSSSMVLFGLARSSFTILFLWATSMIVIAQGLDLAPSLSLNCTMIWPLFMLVSIKLINWEVEVLTKTVSFRSAGKSYSRD